MKLSLLSLAAPALGAVLESLEGVPAEWQLSSLAASPDTVINLQVALSYQNIDRLQSELASVSSPDSKDYGKYIDVDAQASLFGPSSESKDKVTAWLREGGATNIESTGQTLIGFSSTIAQANKLLNTTFSVFTNGETHKLRTLAYSVPDDLLDHIDLISPTTYFGSSKRQVKSESLPTRTESQPTKRQLQASCETTINYASGPMVLITPQCLKELYNTVGYKPDPKSGSDIAFASFLGESASYSDLALFEEAFDIPSQNFSILALINGATNDQDPHTEQDGEANLDIQNIVGLVGGLPVGQYITGGVAPFYPDLLEPNASEASNEPYLQLYEYMLAKPNSEIPYVLSQSYADHENTVPPRYANRVCNMIGLLGLRGRTVLAGTGDEGVGAVCRSNRPVGNLYGPPQFTPFFPASCPYITAVGGTQYSNPEWAWNAGGGGFSFYYQTAWYQKAAVSKYLNKHISPLTKEYYSSNNYVNFSGRGLPDVSAHSLTPWYVTYINGTAQPNGGTSAATPVFASIVALLNDARFRQNLPPMGFINPWLYQVAEKGSLNDIVNGGAVGCNGTDLQSNTPVPGAGIIPYASWNATPGWDPVTGLGTPNFGALKDQALKRWHHWRS